MNLTDIYQKSPLWIQTGFLNGYALGVQFHRYGKSCREMLRFLSDTQRWPRDQLQEYQDNRLRRIVKTAYEETVYYKEAMDQHGVSPADIRTTEDLPKLPILTKETARARGKDLLTRQTPPRGWLHGHTSGTTGSPLSLWYDRETAVTNNAVDLRVKQWGGREPNDWIGLFLGRMIVSPNRRKAPFWQPNHVQKQVWFSTFHLSDETIPDYVAEIRRRGLRFLEGYPSTLFILARYLCSRGEKLPMRSVFTSSETLHKVQREVIEEAFACSIYDFYGMAERVIFAGECEAHDGKHLAEEYGLTEIVDEKGNPLPEGAQGYLVGTSLHNEAMPMIRYRTSDVSAIRTSPCSCGRTLIRMDDVSTKAEDIVVTPEGRAISPSVLTHPFKPFDDIEMSQVIQDRIDHLRVKLVTRGQFSADQEEQLLLGLRERLGSSMQVDVEHCESIPRERSGKYRWVISNLDHEHRFEWTDQGPSDTEEEKSTEPPE